MPFYQQMILCMPKYSVENLVGLFKRHAKTVLENGGVLRGIENHGIKPLPERTKRKYAASDGTRLFWEARFVTASFDASPKCLTEIERLLRNEEGVLRFHFIKRDTTINRINSKTYKNPYLHLPNKLCFIIYD